MKTVPFFAILLLLPVILVAQEQKGLQPVKNTNATAASSSRAVVVGISDYQNPQIPDLRFADRDAEAFAAWLRSPAGGSVPAANVQLLLNSGATTGRIIAALGGLVSDCKPGDVALIYFSGHGDVERISKFQRGYWLTWDSPPAVYAAGACALGYLQDIIATLSESGVQVVVVADACRAGKLAGSAVGGTQATSAALAQQFANEIKILSCQPEEFSLEGEQWGGGRGAFSYHLIDALYGMADANSDGIVNLSELGRYLEDKVTAETAPHQQVPFTVGNRTTVVARVNSRELAEWKNRKAGSNAQFAKIDAKGMEDLALSNADSSLQALYRAFSAALERGDLLISPAPSRPSADSLYRLLIQEPSIASLHGLMTRNFAAALMDKGQQVLNRFLNGDALAFDEIENEIGLDNQLMANQFYRAAALLGDKHYYYKNLLAKGLYFNSFAVYKSGISQDSATMMDLRYLRQAVELDSTASFAWLNLCWIEQSMDSLAYYAARLQNLTPNWVFSHYVIGKAYYQAIQPDNLKALAAFQKAFELDSTYSPALFHQSYLLEKSGKIQEAQEAKKRAIAQCYNKMENRPEFMDSEEWEIMRDYLISEGETEELLRIGKIYYRVDSNAIYRLNNYARMLRLIGRTQDAGHIYQRILFIDSLCDNAWIGLGWVHDANMQYSEMEKVFRKCVGWKPYEVGYWNGLGWALLRQKRYDEAELAFKRGLALSAGFIASINGLGQIYIQQNRFKEAVAIRRRYVELIPKNYYSWQTLGQALNLAGDYAAAEDAFQKALELAPERPDLYTNLAQVISLSKRYAEMIPLCRKAISLDSTYASAWNNLGMALLNMGEYSEAKTCLEKASVLNPNLPNSVKHLGALYFRTGRWTEARAQFEKAQALNPNYPGSYLGFAYLLAAETDAPEHRNQALEYVEIAIQKGAPCQLLELDADLAPLRELPEWKALMRRYFPDKQ